jgi:hypothetical protein
MKQIDDATEAKLIASLHDAIEKWWNGYGVDVCKDNIPWTGERTHYLMARAAVSIMLANKDVEVYLNENGYLTE